MADARSSAAATATAAGGAQVESELVEFLSSHYRDAENVAPTLRSKAKGLSDGDLVRLLSLALLPCRADGEEITRGTMLNNDLAIEFSTSTILIGPSGSGKSAFMKVPKSRAHNTTNTPT